MCALESMSDYVPTNCHTFCSAGTALASSLPPSLGGVRLLELVCISAPSWGLPLKLSAPDWDE